FSLYSRLTVVDGGLAGDWGQSLLPRRGLSQGRFTESPVLCGQFGFADQAAIQIFVALGRPRPGKFPFHGPADQTGPKSAIGKEESGTFNRVPKRVRRIVVAKKAVASLRRRECRVIILNDFVNTATCVRDWDRSISQAIHCD